MSNSLLSIIFGTFFTVLIIVFALISGFNLIYPITIFFSDQFTSIEFYQEELSSGLLGLRIASLILSIKTVSSLFYLFASEKYFHSDTGYPLLDNLPVKEANSADKATTFVAGQLLIYQAATFSLWLSNLFLGSVLEVRLISWALFFIIDDWAIISEYFKALKGRILKSHLIRIALSNIFFCCALPVMLFRNFNWWSALIVFICLFALSIPSFFYFWTYEDSNADGLQEMK